MSAGAASGQEIAAVVLWRGRPPTGAAARGYQALSERQSFTEHLLGLMTERFTEGTCNAQAAVEPADGDDQQRQQSPVDLLRQGISFALFWKNTMLMV